MSMCQKLLLISMVFAVLTELCTSLPSKDPNLIRSFQPLRGTFLDVAYDLRLTYVNPTSYALTCDEWIRDKFTTLFFEDLGLDMVIFQSVHDARWGSYYPSGLPFMQPLWNGSCPDVLGAAFTAARAINEQQRAKNSTRRFLIYTSDGYASTEYESASNTTVLNMRSLIMQELVKKYDLASPLAADSYFGGWYFTSESYITSDNPPLFPAALLQPYLSTLAPLARTLTPNAKNFISPFGTHRALNSSAFVQQLNSLSALGVDAVYFQDEVGCVRDKYPVRDVAAAWQQLSDSFESTPLLLGANIESFTWQKKHWPNNVTTPLISASFDRVVTQFAAAAAAPAVQGFITFSAQVTFESPNATKPWGCCGNDTLQLFEQYRDFVSSILKTTVRSQQDIASLLRNSPTSVPLRAVTAAWAAADFVSTASAPVPLPNNASAWTSTVSLAMSSSLTPRLPLQNVTLLVDGNVGGPHPNLTRWLAFQFVREDTKKAIRGGSEVFLNVTLQFEDPISTLGGGTVAVRLLKVPPRWFVDGSGHAPQAHEERSAIPVRVTFEIGFGSVVVAEETLAQTELDIRPVVYWAPLAQITNLTALTISMEFDAQQSDSENFVFVDEVFLNF